MREKILETSIALFDQKGYKETSIQDIVDEIGVTKGTFYYYFTSKPEILNDICLSFIESQLEKQEEILSNDSLSCEEQLYELVRMVIYDIKSKKTSARIFFRDMRHIEEQQFIAIKEKRTLFRKNYQRLIEMGISQGVFKSSMNANILTFGILGVANWAYYWFQPDGEVTEEQLVEIYMDLILNGILE
ncbi:MAG: TetR/AcrR family transcriptional regulator [Bacillus sp. (in: firmicutes)]